MIIYPCKMTFRSRKSTALQQQGEGGGNQLSRVENVAAPARTAQEQIIKRILNVTSALIVGIKILVLFLVHIWSIWDEERERWRGKKRHKSVKLFTAGSRSTYPFCRTWVVWLKLRGLVFWFRKQWWVPVVLGFGRAKRKLLKKPCTKNIVIPGM